MFLLAGQSNMVGMGIVRELPSARKAGFSRVRLFEEGQWHDLLWRDTFGPELGFSLTLARRMPKVSIVLCKTAVSGANLQCDWNPDGVSRSAVDAYRGPLYPVMIDAVHRVVDLLRASSTVPVIAGLLWMQGERDSVFDFMARNYAKNLRNLVRHVRRDTGNPGLPVVMGRIAPRVYDLGRMAFQHAYRDIVRRALGRVATTDRRVRLVETDDLPQSDNLHYTTGGQLELGRRFAEAWCSLASRRGMKGGRK